MKKTMGAHGSARALIPCPGCFPALILAVLLIFPLQAYGLEPDRVVVRNDAHPLQPDLETGRFGTGTLYFDDPVDLAVDSDGDVYILDAGNFRIQVMSGKGRFLRKWGGRGSGDGQFGDPVAIAVSPDGDFLVTVDRDPARIQVFKPDGSFVISLEGKRIGKGSLDEPVDVTVDSLNYIYVLDRGRGKVLKFHRNGTFVEEWGTTGSREKDLSDPVSLAYSDELTGLIYVLDAGKKNLLIFNRDGDYRGTVLPGPELLPDAAGPLRVESDMDGNLFVLDAGLGKLLKLEKRKISVFALRSDTVSLARPAGLAVDPERGVYITDLERDRLYRFPLELD